MISVPSVQGKPGILDGTEEPDVSSCIGIASEGALQEMKLPSYMAVTFPILGGFVFGADFVGGVLIGAIMFAIMLALYTGNLAVPGITARS